MNVWILDRAPAPAQVRPERERGQDRVGHASEWIDPESADWFATSNLELSQGPEPAEPEAVRAPELDHWFG